MLKLLKMQLRQANLSIDDKRYEVFYVIKLVILEKRQKSAKNYFYLKTVIKKDLPISMSVEHVQCFSCVSRLLIYSSETDDFAHLNN